MAQVKLVTVRDAAKMLNRQVRTVRNWIYKGKLDAVKNSTGFQWLVFVDDINRILEAENHADKD